MVLDDYRVVMPLPVGRELLKILQLQRAPFTQQSGPFGNVQNGDLAALLAALPRRVIQLTLPLNERVEAKEIPDGFKVRERTNLVLDISPDQEQIRQGFSKTLRKKLRRYPELELLPAEVDTVIEIYRASSGKRAGLNDGHYRKMRALIQACQTQGIAKLYRIEENDKTLAAGFFPNYKGRTINLFAGSTAAGFEHDGMARLLDAVIREHRGPGALLDFEGSDIPGVADFFRSFGAQERKYLQIKR